LVSRKEPAKDAPIDLEAGKTVLAEVTDVDDTRALLDLGGGVTGMMMFHDLTPPQSPANLLMEGDQVRVRIKSYNETLKRAAVELAAKVKVD
jgi:ribosomal protein S1